jgi:NADH-quinone oxidoreductase subunit J
MSELVAVVKSLFYAGWQYDWAFVVISGIIILAALGVVLLRNIIHSALCLVVTFLGVAAVYFQLGAEFVALVQIMVYAGAVSILIIFAVMLVMDRAPGRTNLPVKHSKRTLFSAYAILLTCLGLGLSGMLTHWPQENSAAEVLLPAAVDAPGGATRALAHLFMGDYVIAFEIAAVLLLVAVVGAIILAKGAKDS